MGKRPGPRLGPCPLVWAKTGFWLLGLLPLLRWVVLGFTGGLGANPTEFLIRSSGTFTLVALLVTLAITPMRRLTGNPAWLRLRRLCGLFTFFYACLHWLAYLWWDRWFDPAAIWQDAWQRPLIAIGWLAWTLLLVLALTSTQGWQRRLGRHWQRLHRLIYPVLLLALLHFWLHRAGKNDFADVIVYGAIGIALLAWRLPRAWRSRKARPTRI
ncbi:MAG: sulfoxide reductase heme-binding subunit YedZ [Pigmentiphaga sp.]|nr:sulfoxide reductase heme-binding subunit YedZ [Pigmentiphaga sp.]